MTPYPVVETLVEHDPSSAMVPDGNGKLALDYAIQTFGTDHLVTELLAMVEEFDNHKHKGKGAVDSGVQVTDLN